MKLTDFKALTFDCWNADRLGIGHGGRAQAAGGESRPRVDAQRDTRGACAARISQQIQTPAKAYRDLLPIVYRRLAEEWGVPVTWQECVAYGQSVRNWPAFTDSAGALQYLKKHYKLVILSNVDNESFAASNERLQVEFDAVYTAEDCGSYKPSDRNFDYMIAKLETLGIKKNEILHTAEALRRSRSGEPARSGLVLDLPSLRPGGVR